MKKELNQIGGKVTHPAQRDIAGIGYVVIPDNMDMEEYLKACLRNSTVTIIDQNGEIIKNIFVSRNAWNEIEFPKDKSTKGSSVVWLNIQRQNKPIVVAVLNKVDQLNKANTSNGFNFERGDNDSTSSKMSGDGDSGIIDIIVDGVSEGESEINIKVLNKSEEGKLNIYVQGDINIESENDLLMKLYNIFNVNIVNEADPEHQTNISYQLGEGFVYNDEFGNNITINETNVKIVDKNGNEITTDEYGIEAKVENNKISLRKEVAGIAYKGQRIKISDEGIEIEALDKDIQINSGDNVIQMNDSGINIDGGGKSVFINGRNNVLYSKIPGLTAIADVSQIGVSKTVKVG